MQSEDRKSGNQAVDLQLLKREVDALQIAVQSQRSPWYRNVPTIISVAALLFSFGTTYVSYKRIESQDIQAARIELRGLLQRLAALPLENYEITKKYEVVDAAAVATIGGFINQENTMLARQAAELSNEIPSSFISATEYHAIGSALQMAYDVDGAAQMFTKAIEHSTDMNDRVGALRLRAGLYFSTNRPEAGRVDFQRALNVFSDFKNVSYNEYTKQSTHIWTEIAWAYSEANIGETSKALEHVENAESHVSGLIDGPTTQQLRQQINQARTLIRGY